MICKDCKKRTINSSRSKRCCDICLDKRIASQNKYHDSHLKQDLARISKSGKARKDKLKSMGLCIICGKRKATRGNQCSECSDRIKPYAEKYREENKKKVQESQKRSMAKKPELYKAIKHKTYENHKEDWYRWSRERRTRLENCEGSYTQQEWEDLLDYYGNKCLACGSTENLEADHIVPIAKKGTGYITNIQPLCRTCNRKKHTKILDFRAFGSAILEWT